MSKWNITKLITAGSLSVVYLVLALSGGVISAMTGVLGAGGIINIFIGGLMLAICCLLIKKFWAATIMGLIYGTLSLPLPLLVAPGFLPKILIMVMGGLAADSVYVLLKKYEKLAAITISIVSGMVIGLSVFGLALLFSIPGAAKMGEMWLNPLGVGAFFILASLGGYVAWLIYKKLKNTAIVRRIQS